MAEVSSAVVVQGMSLSIPFHRPQSRRFRTAFVQPISSAPKPQVSDAISGENSEVEHVDTKQSVDNLDEK